MLFPGFACQRMRENLDHRTIPPPERGPLPATTSYLAGKARFAAVPMPKGGKPAAHVLPERRLRIGERFLHEHRLARKPGCGLSPVDIEFVLALDRHIDPRLRRMKVEMAWPKLHSVPRLDRREIRQHGALETVGLDRT